MKKIWIIVALIACTATAKAQFKDLFDKAKSKVQQRVEGKVEKAIDKTFDGLGGESAAKPSAEAASSETGQSVASKPGIVAYSKFDFVPGERVIYTEDFAQDAIGELPLTWNSSGKGEVMTIDGKKGNWARGYQKNTLLSGNKQKFGENYTIEFDLIYYFNPQGNNYVMPDIKFGMFSSGTKDNTDNSWLTDHKDTASLDVTLHPSNNSSVYIESSNRKASVFTSDKVGVPLWSDLVNVPMHFSIQVQKTRFRMWRNETKLFDVPRGIAAGTIYNQLYFAMTSSSYEDDRAGYYITNIKVATGVPDTRHKLIEEGRFSTTGILFDVQSALIKPESFGVIREIAGVLKENPGVNVKIVGHTSSDGDAKANLELSNQRAAAVKVALVKDFGIETNRLQTDGRGEDQPVADNKTKEGKSQNRRVEFIKL